LRQLLITSIIIKCNNSTWNYKIVILILYSLGRANLGKQVLALKYKCIGRYVLLVYNDDINQKLNYN